MKINEEDRKNLEAIYQSFLNDEKIIKMKDIPMHRGSNCYIHSFKVAKLAVKRALRHKKGNLYTILTASILHDYYIYPLLLSPSWPDIGSDTTLNNSKSASRRCVQDLRIDPDVIIRRIPCHKYSDHGVRLGCYR